MHKTPSKWYFLNSKSLINISYFIVISNGNLGNSESKSLYVVFFFNV